MTTQKQKTIKTSTDSKGSTTMKDLKAKFETIQKVNPTRSVFLRYKSCCGCGCETYKIERTVPHDSKLKTGDYINNTDKGDKQVGVWRD